MKRRNDMLLVSVLLLAALLSGVWMQVSGNEDASRLVIWVDGERYGVYALDKDQEIEIRTKRGYNHVHIENREVWMEEADCPDGYCTRQGKIRDASRTIVCLPHKLVVEVTDHEDEPILPDAVAG